MLKHALPRCVVSCMYVVMWSFLPATTNLRKNIQFRISTSALLELDFLRHLTKQNPTNQSFCVFIQWVAVVVAPFNVVRTWRLSVSIVLIGDTADFIYLFFSLFSSFFYCLDVFSFRLLLLQFLKSSMSYLSSSASHWWLRELCSCTKRWVYLGRGPWPLLLLLCWVS